MPATGVALLLLPLLAPVAVARPAAAAPASAEADPVASDEATAGVQAQATGTRVEVLSRRSGTEQVFAEPDGTLTAEISVEPQRVQQPDGSWAPVDLNLHEAADGSIVPLTSPYPVAFSGGGAAPAVRIERAGKSLALGWPGQLPVPVLSGDTATYADVFPGVDMLLRADPGGFSELLVIKTREAAQNTALSQIRFGLEAPGLTMSRSATGGFAAIDAAGGTVFQAPDAQMWDSSGTADGATTESLAPTEGAHIANVAVKVGDGALALVPDQTLLTAADTRFPVVIDPSVAARNPAWTEINQFSPNSAGWRTVPTSLAVGFQNFQPPTRVRSFVRFALDSHMFGAHVLSGTLNVFENWSSSCQARAIDVGVVSGFSSATTWNNQPAWPGAMDSRNVAHGHDAGCPAAGIDFNVASGVVHAAAAHTGITFELRAHDENDALAWKKTAVNPTLTVRFNHRPNTPAASGLSTNNPTTHCATTQASAPHVNVTPNGGIKLLARVGDPDGDQVRVTYDFRPLNGSPVANPTTGLAAGGTFAVTIKPPALRNGTTYAWHVQVTDTVGDKSAVSAWCYLVEDSLAPSPPVVTSDDYPTDAYAGFSGRDGLFTISPGADGGTDIAHYYYGFDQPTPTTQATPDGPTVPLPLRLIPHGYGPHDLWVRSEDTAGNRSAPIPYHFYVGSPTDTSGYWKFDEGSGSTAQSTVEDNPASAGPTATLSPTGASWVPGHTGTAIRLDGATGYVTEDASVTSPIDGYTVSAWGRLTSKAHDAAAVSGRESGSNGFFLGYVASLDRWCLTVRGGEETTRGGADGTGPLPLPTRRVCSAAAPTLGVWTHLSGAVTVTAISPLPRIRMRLDVNGVTAGELATVVGGTGTAVDIGRAATGLTAAPSDKLWSGDIDDVRVYRRSLAPGELTDIIGYASNASVAGRWNLDEAGGTTAADSSGKAHPLTLTTGAAFAPTGGNTGGGLVLDGVTGAASTAAPVVRTDQGFVVSAVVRLARAGDEFTVLSQNGTKAAGFALRFEPDGPGIWTFGLPPGDVEDGVAIAPAHVVAIDQENAWVHVTGSYDAFTHKVMVRVTDDFGTRVGYGTQARPWSAAGALQVGRAWMADDTGTLGYADQLPATVDGLTAWTGVLAEADLRTLDNS